MKVYLINPIFTLGENFIANQFYSVCEYELSKHVEIILINNETVLQSARPTREDIIVFFNREDQNYSNIFISFLGDVIEMKSGAELKKDLIPIAVDKDMRVPPKSVSQVQSFDLVDELRRRCLTSDYVPLISTSLARTIVARLQPTLSKDNMKLFISHRRLDGEEIAGTFCRELRGRAAQTFRDLIDIRVGDDAQQIIEENLRASDAVIFLDTPKTGESDWVDKEIKMALSLNLPIVWVRLGSLEGRVPLKTLPSGSPHFEFLEMQPLENSIDSRLIDEIINKAFDISREYAKCVFDQMRQLKLVTREKGIELVERDPRNMIYQVSIPRIGFKYNQRPMTHLLQIFGRFPKEGDINSFIPKIDELGYNLHPFLGSFYDAPILLAPIPGQNIQDPVSPCLVDSFNEYISAIQTINQISNGVETNKKGIIISGAFPDCEPEFQQTLTDAVHAFTEAILSRNNKVIFGAHPTFQHLILDLGKRLCPTNYKELIHLYISKYFVTDSVITEYRNNMTVIATDVINGDRQDSLTLMRKKMIENQNAVALIALGGKTDSGGHLPGVDEEIELARSYGIPVFIIGSVGGRTAQLSTLYKKDGWTNIPNSLSVAENEKLMLSQDYRNIATKILNHLNI